MAIRFDTAFNIYGGFMELDSEGNVLQVKIFSNSFLSDAIQTAYYMIGYLHSIKGKTYILLIFSKWSIFIFNIESNSTSVIITGGVNYGLSGLGYSEDSYVDSLLISLDASRNVQWATIFDYNLNYDSYGKSEIYDSIIYFPIYAGYINPTLVSLNSTTGKVINTKMFSFFMNAINDVWGKVNWIHHIDFNLIASTSNNLYGWANKYHYSI